MVLEDQPEPALRRLLDSMCDHREHPPLPRNALQRVCPTIVELDAGPGDQILHRGGDDPLPGPGQRGDPGPDVHGDALDVSSRQLDLPRVNPHSDLEADRTDPLARGPRALD